MKEKIEKIKQAIKEHYKTQAKGQIGGGICDDCNRPLVKGKTYLIPGNHLWCESCTDKFLNADYIEWTKALKDVNSYFGPGLPAYIQNIADGKSQSSDKNLPAQTPSKDKRRFVELEWVCPNCESRNKGSKKTCENCGAPQPENVKFHRAADEKIVTDEKLTAAAKAGADIHCGFCGTRNPGNAATCSQCGGDLKEGKAREAGQVLQAAAAPKMVICTNCGAENPSGERLCAKCGSPLPRAESAQPQPVPANVPPAAKASIEPKKINWRLIGGIIGALVLCCVIAFAFIFPSQSVQGTVSGVEWKTVVPVEEKQPVNYTNRTGGAPGDAYNVSCHTESKEVCEDKTVDQGNGFAEVVRECYTDSTEYCDYTVNEWKTIQTYPLTGNDLYPVYEEPSLYGEQRIGNASEELTVYFDTEKGNEVYHPDSISEFQRYEIGSVWTLNMNAFGGIVNVER